MQETAGINALVASFLADMEARRYSARSVLEYGYSLRGHLLEYLASRGISAAEAITKPVLADLPRWLHAKPTPLGAVRSAGDLNKTLAVVRSFFRFLKREGFLACDPTSALTNVRMPDRLPRNVLTPLEARRILESIDTSTAEGYRDRAIMELFYGTGLRLMELISLELANVNLEEGLLRINNGKGGRDRVVPLGRIACQFLATYIAAIRPLYLFGARPSQRLFLGRHSTGISRTRMRELVVGHAQRAGIKKHVSPHVWRHSCATHLLKNNANLRHVQDLLGHAQLSTTQRYLRVTVSDLKEAHRRYHPREKKAVLERKE